MKSSTDQARAFFDAEAEQYTLRSDTGFWRWWRRRERAAIWRLLRPRAGERVLDAGCGTGYYARALRDAGAKVFAVDFAPAMARAVSEGLSIPALAVDLQRPFTRPVFDAVLCAGALEFCSDPEAAMRHMAGALSPTPGSRLVAMLPAAGLSGWLYSRYHRRHGLQLQLFPPDRIRQMAWQAGLRVDEAGTIGFNYVVRFRPIGLVGTRNERQ
ncbi:class I SAM-dependent methyltransferase [bacterium]|nr:class I SAM-dependent methyltransferase [bacterium]